MQLTEAEIHARLAADFGGSLLFQPLRVTEDAARPVTLLAKTAQLLPRSADLRALSDAGAAQRLRDLIFDQPAPRRGQG